MPISNWTKVTVRYNFAATDDQPVAGDVTFTPEVTDSRFIDAGLLEIVYGRTITGGLNSTGSGSVNLYANDDPDLTPRGWTYKVTEPSGYTYSISVPIAAATAGIDLATLAPAGSSGGSGATSVSSTDPRLTDTRTPTAGSVVNASVATGAAIAEPKLALASDAAAGTASRRTLGLGAAQAAAGNDVRLSDTRIPSPGTVVDASVSATAAIAESKLALASDAAAGTASRRTLGTGATQAAAGNDSRFGAGGGGGAPALHATTHIPAGTDPVLPTSSTNGYMLAADTAQPLKVSWIQNPADTLQAQANPFPQYLQSENTYKQVMDEGLVLPARPSINFIGRAVAASDDATNLRTVISIPGPLVYDTALNSNSTAVNNSATTFVTPALLQWTVTSDPLLETFWYIQMRLVYTSLVAAGFKLGIVMPTGCTFTGSEVGPGYDNTIATTAVTGSMPVFTGAGTVTNSIPNYEPGVVRIDGRLRVPAANAGGAFGVKYTQGTATVGDTFIKANSWHLATSVAAA